VCVCVCVCVCPFDFQVVQLLLSSNMCAAMLEPKPCDPNGVSPLHLAAKNGHIDVIRWEIRRASACVRLQMSNCLPI